MRNTFIGQQVITHLLCLVSSDDHEMYVYTNSNVSWLSQFATRSIKLVHIQVYLYWHRSMLSLMVLNMSVVIMEHDRYSEFVFEGGEKV